jgi:hypothetical protein
MAEATDSKSKQAPTGMTAGKRVTIGLNVLLQALIVIAIIGVVNYIGFRRFVRWDLSRSQKFALSEQTKNLLGSLQKPVKAVVYFAGGGAGQVYGDVTGLLREYDYASKGKLTIEEVNPYRNLTRAKELAEQYRFGEVENIVILDYDGKSKFVNAQDMVEMDMGNPMFGQPPQVKAFKGEQALTSSLLELVEGKPQKLYITTGHGEPEVKNGQPERPDDAVVLGEMLKRSNIKHENLSLLDAERIPEDATAVMIFGAKQDFSDREIQLLDQYWNNKGRLFVLLHGSAKTPRLNTWLAGIGVKPLGGPIVALVPTMDLRTGQRSSMPVWEGAGKFSATAGDVLRDLAGQTFRGFDRTTALEIDRAKTDAQMTSLAESVKQFWLELDPVAGPAVPSRDPAREKEGPFTLAASVEKGAVQGVKVDTSRMIVAANSGFLTDAGVQQDETGLDFGLNGINWLLNRESGAGAGIPPKEKKLVALTLDEAKQRKLALGVMGALPGLVALFGLISWWQRRN